MLITKKLNIKISKKNIEHFKKQGYDVKLSETIEIPTMNLNRGSHIRIKVKCDVCGLEKEISFQKYVKNINNGGFYACSSRCAQEKVKMTSLNKFGKEYYTQTNEYKNRVIETSIKNHGVEHHLKSEKIKEKIAKTNKKLYGVENPFASNTIQEKMRNTNLKIYKVENPAYNKEVKNKISISLKDSWKSKNLEYYKDLNIIDIDGDVYEFPCDCNKNHNFKITRTLLINRRQLKTTLCTVCFPPNSYTTSGLELQLREFIEKNYNGEIIYGDKNVIKPNELDIYLPELKIAIEFNGVYWHCELEKPNDYHLMKYNKCKKADIELVQVWQDDWLYKQNIIKSILLNKLDIKQKTIYARKCEVKIVPNADSVIFLEQNHLKGKIYGKVNIGLYYNGELISLMVFGKLSSDNYEILRYCNELNTVIIGGASKILKCFIKNYKINELITYFDKSFGFDNLYTKIGFKYMSDTKPDYCYVVDGIRRHKYNYRKNILVKQGYNANKTEREIMLERKIYRIYDVGNIKYVYSE